MALPLSTKFSELRHLMLEISVYIYVGMSAYVLGFAVPVVVLTYCARGANLLIDKCILSEGLV